MLNPLDDLMNANLAELDLDDDNPSNGDDPMRDQEEARRESAPEEEAAQPHVDDADGPAEDDEKVKDFNEEKAKRRSGQTKGKRKGPKPIDFAKHAVTGVTCPIYLLPKVVQDFVGDTAYRLQCAPDLVVIPALCGAGAMLGKSVRVQPKWNERGWTERPAIWGAVVAPPSSMKTPSAKAAMAPIEGLQKRFYAEHKEELEAYDEAHAEYKAAPRNNKPPAPPKPSPGKTVVLNNMTTERAMALQVAQENSYERGMLIFVDELASWLLGFNQYKNGHGNDREGWLTCWSGGPYSYERVNSERRVYIPDAYISIFGGIQPDKAKRLFGGTNDDDGMVQRFGLVAMLDETGETVPRDVAPNDEILAAYKQRLLDLGKVPERLVKFSAEASEAFAEWESATRNTARQISGPLGTHVLKYTALAPRLALVWHFLDQGKKAPEEIPLETFERVRQFIDAYLKPHAERLYSAIAEHACKPAARKVAEWILKAKLEKFTARDIRRKQWREFNLEDDRRLIDATLNYLEAMNWVELRDDTNAKGGRPTSAAHVNPRVFEEFPDGLGK
jgi:hypothetical protein